MLQDIATTVGATLISEDVGMKLDKVELTMLGRAQKVIASKDSTIMVDEVGSEAR
jgi:chaperonin GroEL